MKYTIILASTDDYGRTFHSLKQYYASDDVETAAAAATQAFKLLDTYDNGLAERRYFPGKLSRPERTKAHNRAVEVLGDASADTATFEAEVQRQGEAILRARNAVPAPEPAAPGQIELPEVAVAPTAANARPPAAFFEAQKK